MASALIHLRGGWQCLKDGLKVASREQFYLGCVAPDSVNVDGFAVKEMRWAAHRRAARLDKWRDNVARFYQEQQGRLEESLLRGYVTHLLGDILWDEEEVGPVRAQAGQLGREGWEECFRYDKSQAGEAWWTGEVLPALRAAQPQDAGTVSEDQMRRFVADLTQDALARIPKADPLVVTPSLVDGFARRLSGQVRRLLEDGRGLL